MATTNLSPGLPAGTVAPGTSNSPRRRRRLSAGTGLSTTAAAKAYVSLIPHRRRQPTKPACAPGCSRRSESFVDRRNLLPRGVKLKPKTCGAGCAFVLSARCSTTVSGQTKEKLNNRDARELVASLVRPR